MDSFLLVLTILYHPADTFRMIKIERQRIIFVTPIAILLLTIVVRLFCVNITHFPLADINPWETSLFNETVKLLVPIISFIIMYYATTTIMGGECIFREILLAVSLCFVPYLICFPLLSLFSLVLGDTESGLYKLLCILVWVWIYLLIFSSIMIMNNYTFRKTLLIVIITVIAMAVFWAVCVLIFALANQFIEFIKGIIIELRIRITV